MESFHLKTYIYLRKNVDPFKGNLHKLNLFKNLMLTIEQKFTTNQEL